MGSRELVDVVRLVDSGADFLNSVGCACLVSADSPAAAGHDLQEVNALLQESTRLTSNTFHPIGFAIAPPEVSTGNGQGWTAHQ